MSEPITPGSGIANCFQTSGLPNGVVRCGFAAKAGTTRLEAGATFNGVMEMSGNVYEFVMGVGGAGANFNGTAHGDGNLQFTPNEGLADVTGWINQAVTVNQAAGNGATLRGGSLSDGAAQLNVSDRNFAANNYAGRGAATGGRGVRRSFN